ncbi:MAG TPA: hypothetical protein VEA18_02630 [Candidatus Kapabacteria bacterium]|nr:hypothetical protein [Candidatus Kapabacteria bacterium]
MLEHLFGSKTRLRLLRVLFQHPTKPFYVRELTRLLETQINAVRREIDLLLKTKLIKEIEHTPAADDIKSGSALRKYYALNTESIIYPELHALLIKGKAMGEEKLIEALKEKAGNIFLFLLTGQFTRDTRAQSDILLVGDIDERAVARLIATFEKELGFDIRFTILTEQEFADRRYVMDKFLYSLFESKHVKVVDKRPS